jgi:ABC-type dipeptide/oligopeptide/nickel transport system ATPase subunit
MQTILKNLENWFSGRPYWLCDAMRRIVQKSNIDKNDFSRLVQLCKQEAGIKDPDIPEIQPQDIPKGAFQLQSAGTSLRLDEMYDLRGINALSPRTPLNFGQSPLAIIYGPNGSGKSGYVRTLKHACGAKNLGTLHGNIFERVSAPKSCKFKINNGQSPDIHWTPAAGVCDDLRSVEIYDTDCGNIYLTDENTVTYEPPLLAFFSKLIELSENVGQTIKSEIDRSMSLLPPMPDQLKNTIGGQWYIKLTHQITQTQIDKMCLWDQTTEERFSELNNRLKEADPAKQAKQLRIKKTNLKKLHSELTVIRDKICDENCLEYIKAKKHAAAKRKAANEDAEKVFSSAPLDGVGSDSWRLLWEQARIYSESEAYRTIDFPNISANARCPLCQQALNANAKDRFGKFEKFVKGELQKLAYEAEKVFKTLKADVEEIIPFGRLSLMMDAADITDEAMRKNISNYYNQIIECADDLSRAKKLEDIKESPAETLLKRLKVRSHKLETQALKYDEDAKGQNREKLQEEAKELEARQWLSTQKQKIEKEVTRLNKITLLKKALRSTNTGPLSTKKSELADSLITPAFINRFKAELKTLGASRIKVELKKTRTERGRVLHKIQLENCVKDICPTKVLSEGEFRIVSLAAFLADVTGPGHNTPFIFDDPISSLDQDFEEKTVDRLVDLCGSRQVIVFTHRLSLFTLLQESAGKKSIKPKIISLRTISSHIGEPGDTAINESKPDKALINIRDHRLAKARKILSEEGPTEYESYAKGICSDIRILIERLIEKELISEVVLRFRRGIQTMNRIHNLAKITPDDCKFIDDFMTEYSKYEHSQSPETPVATPDPDELEADVIKILDWLSEFKKRTIPA